MSWFTEMAGKAEDFLTKVDQGAATALSKESQRTSSFSTSYEGDSGYGSTTTGYNKTHTSVTEHSSYASSPPHDAATSFISTGIYLYFYLYIV